jgi:hypothetical protein
MGEGGFDGVTDSTDEWELREVLGLEIGYPLSEKVDGWFMEFAKFAVRVMVVAWLPVWFRSGSTVKFLLGSTWYGRLRRCLHTYNCCWHPNVPWGHDQSQNFQNFFFCGTYVSRWSYISYAREIAWHEGSFLVLTRNTYKRTYTFVHGSPLPGPTKVKLTKSSTLGTRRLVCARTTSTSLVALVPVKLQIRTFTGSTTAGFDLKSPDINVNAFWTCRE